MSFVAKKLERSDIKVDGVFDIETERWDRFVCAGIKTHEHGFKNFDFKREDDAIDYLLSLDDKTIWGHNAGRYDSLWLLDHVAKRDIQCRIHLAGRIVAIDFPNGLRICDSAALVPLPLKDACKIGKVKKIETGLPCECGDDCGGYCAIRRDRWPKIKSRILDYLEIDCEAVLSMLDSMREIAAKNDFDLRGTIGSSVWRTAMRRLGLPKAKWDWEGGISQYCFAREAYFGGRVQVIKPKSERGFQYDIRSAYPYAMEKLQLPIGNPNEYFGPEALRQYNRHKEGVFRACVVVDASTFLPPLPLRTDERLAYPVGTFWGTWTGLELRHAENQGAVVRNIDRALTWKHTSNELGDLMRQFFAVRKEYGPDSPEGIVHKLLPNSLSGKFAQKPESEVCVMNPEKEPTMCPGKDKCPHRGACRCPVPLDDEHRVWVKPVWRIPESGHIEKAAYVTSFVRCYWLDFATSDGEEGKSSCYSDTDCLFTEKQRTENVHSGLGGWEAKAEYRNLECLAPKTYTYLVEVQPKEKFVKVGNKYRIAKAKGIPDAEKNWAKIRNGEKILVGKGVDSFKYAASRNYYFKRKEMQRCVSSDGKNYGDRILRGELTYPRDAREFYEEN